MKEARKAGFHSHAGCKNLYLQSFSAAINQSLKQRLIVRYGLQDVPITSHIPNGPLAQASATQSENVA